MSKHSFHGRIGHGKVPQPFCTKCGLVLLNNDATMKAARKPCPGAEKSDAPS